MATTQYIGARYVPVFFTNPDDNSNNWKSGVAYDPLTVVTDLNQSYTSKIPVPSSVGRPSENPTYWIMTGAYSAQVEQYRQEVSALSAEVEEKTAEIDESFAEFKNDVAKKNYKYEGMKIVGHTGAGKYATANTLYSFDLAATLGADAIETDVQITSDHVPVCHHNPVVDGVVLKETPSATVLNIEVFSGGYYYGPQKIPTLANFLRICKASNKTALVEFKWESSGHMTTEDLPYVKNVINAAQFDDIVFISWMREPLEEYLRLDPMARCIWLLGDPFPLSESNINTAAELGFYGVGMAKNADSTYIDYAHQQGLKVNVFTFESWDSSVITALNHRADFLTTNSLLTCGDWVHAKTDEAFVATARSVQGIPMISKYFETVCDPTYPFFMNTITSSDQSKAGPARFYAPCSSNRAYSLQIPVRAGDVIDVEPTSVYECSVSIWNTAMNMRVADSGWLTGPYTVPANGENAIICYRKKDDSALEFWDLYALHSVYKGIKRIGA